MFYVYCFDLTGWLGCCICEWNSYRGSAEEFGGKLQTLINFLFPAQTC